MNLSRGETVTALQEAGKGLQLFPKQETEWHWRFLVLKAEVLHVQGLDKASLDLLKEEVPSSLATSEAAVRRRLIQGAASVGIRQLDDAGKFLTEADALVKSFHPELAGEFALRFGTLQFRKG